MQPGRERRRPDAFTFLIARVSDHSPHSERRSDDFTFSILGVEDPAPYTARLVHALQTASEAAKARTRALRSFATDFRGLPGG